MARQVLIFVVWRAPAPTILQVATSVNLVLSSGLALDKFLGHLPLSDWAG